VRRHFHNAPRIEGTVPAFTAMVFGQNPQIPAGWMEET
jgi:hypothetical protein